MKSKNPIVANALSIKRVVINSKPAVSSALQKAVRELLDADMILRRMSNDDEYNEDIIYDLHLTMRDIIKEIDQAKSRVSRL